MASGERPEARFEAQREHLHALAYRMLGSRSEAEDAVQEAWLRLARAAPGSVQNLRRWLSTVVARLCLDALRARRTRREDPLDAAGESGPSAAESDAEHQTLQADALDRALRVVQDRLAPAERVAFVLHDLFGVPFDEIAPIVERSPAAARQLASRARRRVQGAPGPADADLDPAQQRRVVEAFLAAARGGDLAALLAVLAPDVVLRADAAAVAASLARAAPGAPVLTPELRGPAAVADTFKGRAQAARLALVDGAFGLAFAPGGQARVVFEFAIEHGRIAELQLLADAQTLASLDLQLDPP